MRQIKSRRSYRLFFLFLNAPGIIMGGGEMRVMREKIQIKLDNFGRTQKVCVAICK
eukprot:TRINITY_DN691_c0_g1_i2.p3 TRINITY_DN691_c0_g1~~TRINITY_DN691_c0_g1_i2.p3  ORF type:complete len:56 (-),score=4.65 TRINITY_DN691_c0_g1_i2:522-689(-)